MPTSAGTDTRVRLTPVRTGRTWEIFGSDPIQEHTLSIVTTPAESYEFVIAFEYCSVVTRVEYCSVSTRVENFSIVRVYHASDT